MLRLIFQEPYDYMLVEVHIVAAYIDHELIINFGGTSEMDAITEAIDKLANKEVKQNGIRTTSQLEDS